MTDYNLRIKLLRAKSIFLPRLEERELVIVDDTGIGQTTSDGSLKMYDFNKIDIKQLYKSMKTPIKFSIERPQDIQEGTTYIDKTDYALKRYNGTNWEIVGHILNLDNNLYGVWTGCINIPILTPPSEDIQYKIEINGDNILIYSNDSTTVLTSGNGGLVFWNNVQSDGKDIRIYDENRKQNYFWIETFDYTNQKTVIWVRLNTSQSELNIAYGNNNCVTSNFNNGSMTFEFFDDFSSGRLDGWTVLGSGSASVVTYDGKYMAKLAAPEVEIIYPFTVNSSEGRILETCTITDTMADGIYIGFTDGSEPNPVGGPENGYIFAFARWTNTQSGIRVIRNYAYITATWVNTQFNTNTYYICGGLWYGNTLISYLNCEKIASLTNSMFSNFSHIFISIYTNYWYFDWVRVRKYLPSDLSFGTPIIKTL